MALAVNSLEWRVRECLRDVLRHERRDYLGFSICIVLLTPALLVGAIVVFGLTGPLGDAWQGSWLSGPQAALYGVGVLLGGMLVALLVRQEPDIRRNPLPPLVGAALAYFAILALGFRTSWPESHPALFWTLVGVLVLVALAFLGRLYEPGDDYYIGWVAGPFVLNNPFTFQDDVDRRHIALGFAVALPDMIVRAYAELFGSSWLLRPLTVEEEDSAVQLLLGVEEGRGPAVAEGIALLGRPKAARVLRNLTKLEMIHVSRRGLGLTAAGRELVETARGLQG